MGVNFDLNDLQAFRAVVELGSFRKAAEAVNISQPALSRRIEKLEGARCGFEGEHASLGFLEERDHLVTTDRGEALEEIVDRVAGLEIFDQRLSEDTGASKHRCPAHHFGIRSHDAASLSEEACCELVTLLLGKLKRISQ